MRPRAEQRCSNCDAWMRQNNGSGLCRALPPSPLFVGMGQQVANVLRPNNNQGAEPIILSYFPSMASNGWCRAWQDAELES